MAVELRERLSVRWVWHLIHRERRVADIRMLLSASNAHIDSACIRVWQSALPPTSNLHMRDMMDAIPCPSIARCEMHVNDCRENPERENVFGNIYSIRGEKSDDVVRETGSLGSLWNLGQKELVDFPLLPLFSSISDAHRLCPPRIAIDSMSLVLFLVLYVYIYVASLS